MVKKNKTKKRNLNKNSILKIIIISFIILIVLSGVTINFMIEKQRYANTLVFYHWWVSPGEQAAINALIDVYSSKYPETTVVPTPVVSQSSGGGGLALFDLLKPKIFAKEAPDAFQMHAGYETKTYVDAELLRNVDSIWQSEDLVDSVPEVVKAMCRFQGHYYSVPINIHRTNVVWFNKQILDKNGINPNDLDTWEKFFTACDKLRESGIKYPIQMGTTWTAQHTFDQIIASLGIDFYEAWVNGKLTSSSQEIHKLEKAFEIFEQYLGYINPDNSEISWDEATSRIISGEGAFNVMGDWANGEFKIAGKKYNKDYGSFEVPGTQKMYGLVIDSFQLPKGIQHPNNAENWLKVVASKQGQDAFNPIKGSISARIDTNISKYDTYQQEAILDFLVIKYMFPAISNGMPKDFEKKEQEIIANFVEDLNSTESIKEITEYLEDTSGEYTITWQLD